MTCVYDQSKSREKPHIAAAAGACATYPLPQANTPRSKPSPFGVYCSSDGHSKELFRSYSYRFFAPYQQ